jgi:hypothetical protein
MSDNLALETIRAALKCGQPGCACGTAHGHVHCPAHEDIKTPNLSVSQKNGKVLVKCFARCPQERVITALKEKMLWPSNNGDRSQNQTQGRRIVTTYDYQNPAGKLIFQVVRYDPKDFRQRRPNGAGSWIWGLRTGEYGRRANQKDWYQVKAGQSYAETKIFPECKPVPYRVPELVKADIVFVGEGEKDADNLAALGLTATCNAMGAGKWRKKYGEHFKGKAVVILPDNDNPGRAHAQDVARQLNGIATSVKVLELPGLPVKGDVSDWLAAGGTLEQLLVMVEAAPEYDQDQDQAQDEEIPAPEDGRKKPTQAELLIKLAGDAELFHDMNQKGYATIAVHGHRETWPIRAKGFRSWLLRRFFQATGKAPSAQAIQDALGVLEAHAHFDGPNHDVYVRVAQVDGHIYIDLANESWQAMEITTQGWRVVDNPPLKFRRPRGLAPMPDPIKGGNLSDLKPFINCRDEDWPLVVAWIIGALSIGPYPIMIFQGEQGTAKSFVAKVLKTLVDPGHSAQRTAPRDIRDLMISASNSWCLSFDNLSTIPPWLSDGFCRLATGGGLSTRELYSDDNETILDAMRPVILNGIDSLVSRADLADRGILLELPEIEKDRRRPEKDLWKAFEAAQPKILGAVFNALSAALANVHGVKLPELPRMADFATWIVAAEPALPWEPGTFLDVYSGNRAAVVEHSLEGDVVAVAVRLLMADRETWKGAASDLLKTLEALIPESTKRSKAWPKAANILTNRLRRAATFLRAIGIKIEDGWAKGKGREIVIRQGLQSTVGTVGTAEDEEQCGFSSHDASHDAENGPWEGKVNNHAAFHDTHDSHDKKQTFSKADDIGLPIDEVEI